MTLGKILKLSESSWLHLENRGKNHWRVSLLLNGEQLLTPNVGYLGDNYKKKESLLLGFPRMQEYSMM